jgi:N-acetylated-alpha-linked acidic dipeptidase
MKTILVLVLLVVITFGTPLTFTKAFAQTAIDGFSAERAVAERRWEEQFRAVPDPKSAREHLRRLTLQPHIAGTKEDYDTAVYVRDQLRSYGLTAELKEYEVWLNYPNTPTVLELITPTHRQRLNTREAVVPGDPTSSNPKITPLFNGYSATGDVTAADRCRQSASW